MTRPIAVLAVIAALVALAAIQLRPAAAQPSGLTPRAVVAMVAFDPPPALPQPDAAYCAGPNDGTAPPNSVIGHLTVDGALAPAGTIVQITFDGKRGPAFYTKAAGGYKVNYAAGGQGCANQVGAAIGILVDGNAFDTGVKVGDLAANPVLLYDITAP